MHPPHRIVIVGGGFAGVAAALALERRGLPETHITLLSDKPHLEYHGALYRLVTGRSALETCIPLREIFAGRQIEVLIDRVVSVDTGARVVIGASESAYRYDTLILALGSESTTFGIPGVADRAFTCTSVRDALRLRRHLHETLEAFRGAGGAQRARAAHIIVAGGGATGVELAAELITYVRLTARRHRFNEALVRVTLVEAAPRLLPSLPESFAACVADRVRALGVRVLTGKRIAREEQDAVLLAGEADALETKTFVWTAGARPHRLYAAIPGLTIAPSGRVRTAESSLRAHGLEQVYVAGDGAETQYAGMAQTALADGTWIACAIAARMRGTAPPPYLPALPVYAVPVGPEWAAVLWPGGALWTGAFGWAARRWLDFSVLRQLLPFRKALSAWREGTTLTEFCPICSVDETDA